MLFSAETVIWLEQLRYTLAVYTLGLSIMIIIVGIIVTWWSDAWIVDWLFTKTKKWRNK